MAPALPGAILIPSALLVVGDCARIQRLGVYVDFGPLVDYKRLGLK